MYNNLFYEQFCNVMACNIYFIKVSKSVIYDHIYGFVEFNLSTFPLC